MMEKFAAGLPLIDKKNLPVSAEDVDRLLVFYVTGLFGINKKTDGQLSAIKTAVTSGEISGQHLIDHFVMGQAPFLSYVFEHEGVNNHLLFFVLRTLLKACLTPFQETFISTAPFAAMNGCSKKWLARSAAIISKKMNYLEVEGDMCYNVNLCYLCRRYLKVLDARDFEGSKPLFLDLEDLISGHLNVIAGQKGFTPGISF